MIASLPFLSGREKDKSGLLWRFLPPLPDGISKNLLQEHAEPGSWVFDPFGYSPSLILDAAREGYKVLVSANNPVSRFLVELGANPPDKDDLQSVVAELSSARMGDERLEIHLKNLYKTNCAQCGKVVIARAFIWEREADAPFAKIYECDHCGDSGERPVTQADIQLAQSFSVNSLQRMRVLERIAPPGDPSRSNVEEALSVYLPRAIYALVTLINRLDGLMVLSPRNDIQSIRRNTLIALILSALDQGNNLWSHPSGRERPKQLTSSPRFRENNLWAVIEESVTRLASREHQISCSIFPDMPPNDGGISIYEGPLRELTNLLPQAGYPQGLDINAVITAIPRHNQAYWTLSALWTGLIWGKDSIGSFKTALRRRRYDWSWHTSALHNALLSLDKILPDGIPILGLIGEADSNFVSASIIAAHQAGFRIQGIALRAESNQAQILWKQGSIPRSTHQLSALHLMEENFRRKIIENVVNYLNARGEPATFLSIHTSSLLTISDNNGIAEDNQSSPAEEYNRINSLIDDVVSYKNGFIRYGGSEKSPETSRIWHQDIEKPGETITDMVESAMVGFMRKESGSSIHALDEFICQAFPGLSTPDIKLVSTCIESYSEKSDYQQDRIYLRSQDDADQRTAEIGEIHNALITLGDRLGYSTSEEVPVTWMDNDKLLRLVFHVISSACISEIVCQRAFPAEKSIIVIPGARANLVLYKLRMNPYLRNEIERGWRFVKFRHLRHLSESPSLNQDNLDTLLELDPLTETPAQMRLL